MSITKSMARWGFLFLYLGVAAIYSIAYFVLSADFYHAAVVREPAYEKYRDEFIQSISKHLESEQILFNSDCSDAEQRVYLIDEFEIDRVKFYEPKDLRSEFALTQTLAEVSVRFVWNDRQSAKARVEDKIFPVLMFADPVVSLGETTTKRSFEMPMGEYRKSKTCSVPWLSDIGIDLKEVYGDGYYIAGGQFRNQEISSALYIPESSEVYLKLSGYYDLVFNGRTSVIDSPADRFVRAAYISIVTITTLGYGDIVPLTTRARVLVASEAFLGILIVGLFLARITSK